MTEQFKAAVMAVLEREGGFVNDQDDPGGATNFGISLRFLLGTGDLEIGDLDQDSDIDADDIEQMTTAQASVIYHKYWWEKYGYEAIDEPAIAAKILDASVNMGAKQAHKLLQRACRSCGFEIAEDGVLGPITLETVNALNYEPLLAAMRSEQAGFYRELIARKPVFEKYRNGWLRRAYA